MLPSTNSPNLNILPTGSFPTWWPPLPPPSTSAASTVPCLPPCTLTRVLWPACGCSYITRAIHASHCPNSKPPSSSPSRSTPISTISTSTITSPDTNINTNPSDPSTSTHDTRPLPWGCSRITSIYEIRDPPDLERERQSQSQDQSEGEGSDNDNYNDNDNTTGLCQPCASLRLINAPRPLPDWATDRWPDEKYNMGRLLPHDISSSRLTLEASRILSTFQSRIAKQTSAREAEVAAREEEIAKAWYDFIYVHGGPQEECEERDVRFGVVEGDRVHVFWMERGWNVCSGGLPGYEVVQLGDPAWMLKGGGWYSGFYYTYGAPHLRVEGGGGGSR
ncbi:hypothetical protein ONS95_004716 [Cadophora gregata]|uniref:uncharacterized protein n=1 Tax=Cadophora gregata TaxID=51156 RepID=UPI0026DAF0FF|nr:uncharacterized protein ONS95_004716 [Cadophora gregata]KAK0104423.1 hypothetical protein ONS95_004716 [Cadophora gregata]